MKHLRYYFHTYPEPAGEDGRSRKDRLERQSGIKVISMQETGAAQDVSNTAQDWSGQDTL